MTTDMPPGFSFKTLNGDEQQVIVSFRKIAVEAVAYGFFAALATRALYLTSFHPSRPKIFLFLALLFMFMISTARVVIHVLYFTTQIPFLGEEAPPDISLKINGLNTAMEMLDRTAFFLSDVVVVWRTWVIWSDNLLVRGFLAICIIATAATSITLAAFNVLENYQGQTYPDVTKNELGTFCLLFTNFCTTLLIAYKAWLYRRFLRQYFAKESLNKTINKFFLVLIESGMLYCIFWVCMEITDYGLTVHWGFDWVQPYFSGIYMASIILLVSAKQSWSETIFAATAHSADESLQFAVNSDLAHQSSANITCPTCGSLVEDHDRQKYYVVQAKI